VSAVLAPHDEPDLGSVMSANDAGFILSLVVATVFLAIVGVIAYRMQK
jgi:hypothetical protein